MPEVRLHLDADASMKALHRALVDRGYDVTRTPTSWMPCDATDEERSADSATAIGGACGPLPADGRENGRHEVDADGAYLPGPAQDQVVHRCETLHDVWVHEARLRAAPTYSRSWIRKVG
jgi:hypothetical protein